MGFLFKKREVPEELPGLAFEEMNKNSSAVPVSSLPQLPQLQSNTETRYKPLQTQSLQESMPNGDSFLKKRGLSGFEDNQGYFKELVKSITEEKQDIGKLDSWYKNKFLPGDVVFQMREYWEKQQPEMLLKNVSGELKNRILEQTNKLHSLEKDWQEIYFSLMAKEEEIRKDEKDLKDSIAEFIGIYKRAPSKSLVAKEKSKK